MFENSAFFKKSPFHTYAAVRCKIKIALIKFQSEKECIVQGLHRFSTHRKANKNEYSMKCINSHAQHLSIISSHIHDTKNDP